MSQNRPQTQRYFDNANVQRRHNHTLIMWVKRRLNRNFRNNIELLRTSTRNMTRIHNEQRLILFNLAKLNILQTIHRKESIMYIANVEYGRTLPPDLVRRNLTKCLRYRNYVSDKIQYIYNRIISSYISYVNNINVRVNQPHRRSTNRRVNIIRNSINSNIRSAQRST